MAERIRRKVRKSRYDDNGTPASGLGAVESADDQMALASRKERKGAHLLNKYYDEAPLSNVQKELLMVNEDRGAIMDDMDRNAMQRYLVAEKMKLANEDLERQMEQNMNMKR